MSTRSQSKPPSLSCDEYQQWKVQMVSFMEGIHPRITEYLMTSFSRLTSLWKVQMVSTIAAEPLQVVPQPPALRWTRDHPIDQVVGDPATSVKTRHQACNHCLYVCFLSENEPSKIEEALADPFWVSAMQEELVEFERNLVLILVHKPTRKTIIDLKWSFRNKLDEHDTVIRNKACLVAQGYRQEEGIDYDETFAPSG
ncbi:hypothetical protein OSB04_024160 [Centaurea solstitialis]|uniref:Reverse transcriptase Ty1/copia-type domain-containing protein n=1 Tax=Centaurea solstitialis TaxID=347529 RepID=A0AA38SL76_9ASTR|nr:hypothetical protein OSB04_024160 [Centaurea solstitialis]